MSGVQGSAQSASALRTPRWPTCASSRCAKSCPQKRSGSYPAPPRSALSCGMILLCDLSRMTARALTSRRASPIRRVPSRVRLAERSDFRKLVSNCETTRERGPAPRRQSRGETSALAADGFKSHGEIDAQEQRSVEAG